VAVCQSQEGDLDVLNALPQLSIEAILDHNVLRNIMHGSPQF